MANRGDLTFGGTWPYEPNWFDTGDGRIHFIDEGPHNGQTVVLVHGNPTWGYLYRSFVDPLVAAGCRVIVPDHLGFGRSEKPSAASAYALGRHVERMQALLDRLDLSDVVLVPHDWGGPISLPWAARRNERVAGVFVLNTLAHDVGPLPGGVMVPAVLRLIRLPGAGEVVVQGADGLKTAMFRLAIERTAALSADVRRAYRDVHRGWGERAGMLAFARQLPVGGGGEVNAINRETEIGLRRNLEDKPVRIVWGLRDRVLSSELIAEAWTKTFPQAEVVRLPEAGHFLQEDDPGRVVDELLDFLSSI